MTRENLLSKLKKLQAHSESAKAIGNEAEAQAFSAMLQKLLLQHKLDMTDVEYAAEMKSEGIVEQRPATVYREGKRFYADFPDVEVTTKRKEWAELLAHIISGYYSCLFLVSTGSSMITFVGHKSNVATCEYIYLTMMRSAEVLSAKAAKSFRAQCRKENGGAGSTPTGYRESWLRGFARRVDQRLKEERDKFGGEQIDLGRQCTALVRIDKEAKEVQQYVEKAYEGKVAKQNRGRQAGNDRGYADGRAVADTLDIKEGSIHKQLGD